MHDAQIVLRFGVAFHRLRADDFHLLAQKANGLLNIFIRVLGRWWRCGNRRLRGRRVWIGRRRIAHARIDAWHIAKWIGIAPDSRRANDSGKTTNTAGDAANATGRTAGCSTDSGETTNTAGDAANATGHTTGCSADSGKTTNTAGYAANATGHTTGCSTDSGKTTNTAGYAANATGRTAGCSTDSWKTTNTAGDAANTTGRTAGCSTDSGETTNTTRHPTDSGQTAGSCARRVKSTGTANRGLRLRVQ